MNNHFAKSIESLVAQEYKNGLNKIGDDMLNEARKDLAIGVFLYNNPPNLLKQVGGFNG